jgi:CPA2 family monovalent cation:H+ antiporter-2
MHAAPLISTIVAGFVLAFILGAVANRLRMPPLVGYLVAGIVVGPYSPGFVADAEVASQLSEIGVVLLMFGVGLHFSLKDLISVQAVAVPGALIRIALGTAMGVGLGVLLNWPLMGGIIFGLAVSVSSTVVLIKALQDRHLVDSERGRIATGWVIVEDIAMILALVLLPALAGLTGATAAVPEDPFVNMTERLLGLELGIPGVLAVTALKLAAFIGFMFVVGKRLIPMVLHYTAHTGSRELFRLAVLAIALGVAAGAAYLFGVSLALGAFFAGMILSESELSHRAAEESLPLRDAFSVLFFVSVGMLFDPTVLWRDPLPVLATLFIIIIGRLVIAYFSLVAFRRTPSTALSISAALAQIGEFSFILATLGLSLGVLPVEGQGYIVAGAIISIFLNPLLIWASDWARPRLEARFGSSSPETTVRAEPVLGIPDVAPEPILVEEEIVHPTALTAHTILIGYGRVGSVIAAGLRTAGKPFLVIEDAEGRINKARAAGYEVIVGNAAASKPLKLANVEGANTIIIAIPNAFEAGQAVEQARRANPNAHIIARAHSDEEENYLLGLGANTAIMGEREIGMAMLDLVNPATIARTAGIEAVANAIVPGVDLSTLPPEPLKPVLTGIDEAALAAAIGAPMDLPSTPSAPPVPAATPAPAPVPAEAPVEEDEPAPVPQMLKPKRPTPPPEPEVPTRARRPSTRPGAAFNPEVAPDDEGEGALEPAGSSRD